MKTRGIRVKPQIPQIEEGSWATCFGIHPEPKFASNSKKVEIPASLSLNLRNLWFLSPEFAVRCATGGNVTRRNAKPIS